MRYSAGGPPLGPGRYSLVLPLLLLSSLLALALASPASDVLQANLRVSEIMYSPSAPSPAEIASGYEYAGVFQFVELWHAAFDVANATALNLTELKVTGAINYTFANVSLAPGQRILLCADPTALVLRYPSLAGLNDTVFGPFGGSLSKGGKVHDISFTLDTVTVLKLRYDEDWYPEVSVRGGMSLELTSAFSNSSDSSAVGTWRVSALGGSPIQPGVGGAIVRINPTSTLFFSNAPFDAVLSVVGIDPARNATIRYTSNRNNPTNASTPFGSAIRVTASVQIRAAAFLDNGITTPSFAFTFIAMHPNLATFQMLNTPIILIEAFGQDLTANDNSDKKSYIVVVDAKPGVDKIKQSNVVAEFMAHTKLFVASPATAQAKKPLLVNAVDEDGQPRLVTIPGFPSHNQFVLYGHLAWDRTRGVRDSFAYQIYRNWFGHYAPRTAFYEAFVTFDTTVLGSALTHYYGIGVLTETPSLADGRLSVSRAPIPADTSNLSSTGSYLIKIDPASPFLAGADAFATGLQPLTYVQPFPNGTSTQTAFLQNWFATFNNSFNLPLPNNTFVTPWMSSINLDETIDYHILYLYAKGVNALNKATYLYKPRDTDENTTAPFSWGPPFDFDQSFGCDDNAACNPATGTPAQMFTANFWGKMFSDQFFLLRYVQRYIALRSGAFNPTNASTLIRSIASEISGAFDREVTRWNYPSAAGGFNGLVNNMVNWSNARFAWMDTRMCYNASNPNAAHPCDDNDWCTADICSPVDGTCINVPQLCTYPDCKNKTSSDNATCTDAFNFCGITNGTCFQGDCIGLPRNCTDAFACTVDSCSVDLQSCVNTPVNASCDDNVTCTIDICDVNLGCLHVPNETVCIDEFHCTVDTCDVLLDCVHTGNDTHPTCDDSITCTDDTCIPGTGCIHTPNDSRCPLPVPCATPTCSAADGCHYVANSTLCTDPPCSSFICLLSDGCHAQPNYSLPSCPAPDGVSGCALSPWALCTGNTSCDLSSGRCRVCEEYATPDFNRTGCLNGSFVPDPIIAGDSGPSLGLIIGAAVGGAVLLLLIGGLLFYFLYYKPRHSSSVVQGNYVMTDMKQPLTGGVGTGGPMSAAEWSKNAKRY